MKKYFLPTLLFSLFLWSGCDTKYPKARYIENSSNYTSFGIDHHDIEKVVLNSAKSLLSSHFTQSIKEKRLLAISNISNQTQEDIDTELMARALIRHIRQSQKFTLSDIAMENNTNAEKMLQTSRNLRQNPLYNQRTTQEDGTLLAPEIALSGKIIQRSKNLDKIQRIDYIFLFTLTDLKTGKILWDYEETISKVADKILAQNYISQNIKSVRCEDANQCLKLGESSYQKQDFTQAVAYWTKACDKDNISACLLLAASYNKGEGVTQDFSKAHHIYNKACDLNDAFSCFMSGLMYRDGKGIEQDDSLAQVYFDRACDLRFVLGGCKEYNELKRKHNPKK